MKTGFIETKKQTRRSSRFGGNNSNPREIENGRDDWNASCK